jgi:hypothetical protein
MEPVVSLLPGDGAADCSLLFGAHKSLSLVDDAQPPSTVRHANIPTRIGAKRILIKSALAPDVPDEQSRLDGERQFPATGPDKPDGKVGHDG